MRDDRHALDIAITLYSFYSVVCVICSRGRLGIVGHSGGGRSGHCVFTVVVLRSFARSSAGGCGVSIAASRVVYLILLSLARVIACAERLGVVRLVVP